MLTEIRTPMLKGKNGRQDIYLECQLMSTVPGRTPTATILIQGGQPDMNDEESVWVATQIKELFNSWGRQHG